MLLLSNNAFIYNAETSLFEEGGIITSVTSTYFEII